MRHSPSAWICALLSLAGCSTTPAATAPVSDSGITNGCGTDAAGCLMGTVTSAAFTPSPAAIQVELHRVFPGGLSAPIAAQAAGSGGSWAFGGLSPWDHYYVRVVGTFNLQSGVTRIVGPLSVPSTGAPLAVALQPVTISVLEARPAGGAMLLVSATARVFDPSTGAEITDGGATVSIAVGDAAVSLPWNGIASGSQEYGIQPTPPLAAQPAYVVSVSMLADGGSPTQWSVIADPPLFDGKILSVGAGGAPDAAVDATVVAQQPLAPTWTPPPATTGPTSADYMLVELFESQGDGGMYLLQYQSPNPETPDTTQENIPGSSLPDPAPYLLNVAYAKAHCDIAAAGCVHASAVAAATFNASAPLADAGAGDAGGD